MGKVQIIQKSRKEHKCKKCGKVIPVGSKYYKGSINFHPDIIMCTDCKLECWEVTTSDYQLQVGEIIYRWQENYGIDESTADNIASDLEGIRDELQDKLDNMPEQLQDSDTGTLLQERIDSLESAIDELNNIDIDMLKNDVIEEECDTEEELSWDELLSSDDVKEDILIECFNNKMVEAIDEIMSTIEM